MTRPPFGFGPSDRPEEPEGNDPFGLAGMFGSGDLFAQLSQLMSWRGGPVNWDLATTVATETVKAEDRPVTAEEARAVVDACRLAGVNEVLAVLLLAAKFGVPVCPHAGGVGLCEYVQHVSIFDYVAVSGSLENRMLEYVDHLHEHFEDPVVIRKGRYVVPQTPGYSISMKPESRRAYRYPDGAAWTDTY